MKCATLRIESYLTSPTRIDWHVCYHIQTSKWNSNRSTRTKNTFYIMIHLRFSFRRSYSHETNELILFDNNVIIKYENNSYCWGIVLVSWNPVELISSLFNFFSPVAHTPTYVTWEVPTTVRWHILIDLSRLCYIYIYLEYGTRSNGRHPAPKGLIELQEMIKWHTSSQEEYIICLVLSFEFAFLTVAIIYSSVLVALLMAVDDLSWNGSFLCKPD